MKLAYLTRFWTAVPFALLSLIAFPSSARGQATATDEWNITVAPYLMLPWMNGGTAVKGHDVNVDISPKDILSNLQIGAMGYFEARKGKWGFGADAVYMALGTTVERVPLLGDRANADIDFNQGAYTFTGTRALNDNVGFLAGVRWNVLQGRIGFKGPNQLVVDQTRQWVDPVVGMRVAQKFGGKWRFSMQGDIGGFGAGSHFAWHLLPVLGRDVGKRTTLALGYRVIGMDYKTGTGQDFFKYDVITQGLVLGAAFHF